MAYAPNLMVPEALACTGVASVFLRGSLLLTAPKGASLTPRERRLLLRKLMAEAADQPEPPRRFDLRV